MALDATARRRWFGVLVLLAALGMLICGQTVLSAHLRGLAFMLYWLACFAFTGVAVLIALLDARALRRRIRQQQRDLFQATLKQVEAKAKTQPRPQDRRLPGS